MANFIHFENSHVFSKAPVQENMPASESVNKSVHTVQAEEIWANKCPFITYNEVKDLTADKTFDSFEGYAPVKFNYKKQVIVLTDINNNGKDSNGLAGKVFIEGKPINQFISETDATDKNGALAFGYRPILFDKDGGAVPSDNYTVNCSNGIIYFTNPVTSTAENCNYFLSFFTYEGAKLDTTITNIKSRINETKDDLFSHASDTDVHIRADERSKWNTAASKAGTAIQTVKRTNNSSTLINVDQSETSVSITLSDTIATKEYIDNHTIYNGVNSNNWNIIQDGSSAFTTSLEDLPSSMPSLTVATGMFEGNSAITEFNIKVPNLVIADNMFSGCTNLTTIDSSFQNVVSATNMFENCPLTSIKLTQPGFANLTEAATYTTDETTNKTTKEKGLFDSAKETLVTATVSMPSLINGTELFRGFTALESYTGDLTSLTNGRWMFGNTALSAWNNDIPKLKNGYAMFFNCSNLTNFTGDIPLLENGVYMFGHTSNLISFTGSLESLIDGHQMFYGNGTSPSDTEKFTFTSNLSKLQNGHRMFFNNKRLGSFNIVEGSNLDSLLFSKHMFVGTSLTEFRYNLPNVGSYETYFDPNEKTDESPEGTTFLKHEAATAMFQNCTSLTTVVSDLSSITNGSMLFFDCTNLQTVDCNFSSMTDHGNMFSGCTSLRTVNANLSSLPDGQCQHLLNAFKGNNFPNIQHISGDMSKLVTGNHCMENKTSLISFTVNLPSLFDAAGMFSGCNNLTTFNSESGLPELVSGHYMFMGCTSLTSFSGDLPKMTKGDDMFNGCTSLTSFSGDMPIMTTGTNMFSGCKLDKDSVLGIINCLKTVNELVSGSTANLTLGIDASLCNDSDILTALGISSAEESSASLTGHRGGTWTITLEWNS